MEMRGWGGGEIIYESLHCHHQNDSCIKMGSDESHFDVSLIVTDQVSRQCPQTTTYRLWILFALKTALNAFTENSTRPKPPVPVCHSASSLCRSCLRHSLEN